MAVAENTKPISSDEKQRAKAVINWMISGSAFDRPMCLVSQLYTSVLRP